MPHVGQARTIWIWADSSWNQLCVILNNAVNVNNLSLNMSPSLPTPPTPPLNVLRNLKELTLSRIVYDESFHEIMKQVEKLDLTAVNTDLWGWLGSSIQLKRLHIRRDLIYGDVGLTTPTSRLTLHTCLYHLVILRS